MNVNQTNQDINKYQYRYWNEMVQLKTTIFYLEECLHESEKLDKYINIYLAITSNGSICGWAIWNEISIVWAIIIAASQLINAIKFYLPFSERIKMISKMLPELDNLFNLSEKNWFPIAEGKLFDEEIHDLNIKIKNREIEIVRKYTAVCSLPHKKSHIDKAMEFAQTYFSNFYKLGGFK